MTNIFVYGTLKSGYYNHSILGNADFLGELVIPNFKLFESGIPFMKRSENPEDKVLGELYKVSDESLVDMDRLEGHPTGYRREKVSKLLILESFYEDIESYIYPHDLSGMQESPKNSDGVYVYGQEAHVEAFGRR